MTSKDKVNLAMAWYDSGLEDRAAFQTLMESILEQPPQRTEPIQSLQCAHCQVTIETLNDKVMHLLAQRKPLTDEHRKSIWNRFISETMTVFDVIDIVEAAHGIKERA
jgi:hypothetical protein